MYTTHTTHSYCIVHSNIIFEKQVDCCHGYSGCLQKKHLVSLAELQVWFKVPCKEEMATHANNHFGFVDTTDNNVFVNVLQHEIFRVLLLGARTSPKV